MKVIIATDGSDFSAAAAQRACELFSNIAGTRFKIVSVFEDLPVLATEPFAVSAEYYQGLTDAIKSRASEFAVHTEEFLRERFGANVEISHEVMHGTPEKCIVDLATNWNAELIVVGSHGRGFWRRLLGSVSDAVVHHAPCSVLVVRSRDETT
jgi:nucleotide-binding universal stress UspA family protein